MNGRAISSTDCVILSSTHQATTSGSTAGKPGLVAMSRRSDWRGFGRSSTRRPRRASAAGGFRSSASRSSSRTSDGRTIRMSSPPCISSEAQTAAGSSLIVPRATSRRRRRALPRRRRGCVRRSAPRRPRTRQPSSSRCKETRLMRSQRSASRSNRFRWCFAMKPSASRDPCSSRTATSTSTPSIDSSVSPISHGSRCLARRTSDGCA